MLLHCVELVFKGTMSKEFYTSIIMNKYFNKTAQR